MEPELLLICRAGTIRCALPVRHVVETMRPLPLDNVPGAPEFVVGVSVVRGFAVPVVSVARLFGEAETAATRLVVVHAGLHRVGLSFDEVSGFRRLSREAVAQLPPLLAIASATAVAQIAVLDGDLLAVLATAGIVPETVFASLATAAAS